MSPYIAEILGTMILIMFGSSLLAGLTLNKTLNQGTNWIVVTLGWGFAVMLGVYVSGPFSGGHLNPAVTIALAVNGTFSWGKVPGYILAQVLGAFVGSAITVVQYYPHFKVTPREIGTRGIFCTGPAIPTKLFNFLSEVIGTFAFMFCVLFIGVNKLADGLNPILLGALVAAIGMSFGPTTGYAINPARDFGPRLAYALLPIPNKSDPEWSYAWIPILGPIVGSILAVAIYNLV